MTALMKRDTDHTAAQAEFMKNLRAAVPRHVDPSTLDQDVVRRINVSRIKLMRDKPFEAALVAPMQLLLVDEPADDQGMPTFTAATDCWRRMWLNVQFLAAYDVPAIQTILAHEAYHAALMHGVRRSGRNAGVFNIACDLHINCILKTRGFSFAAFDTHDVDMARRVLAGEVKPTRNPDRMGIWLDSSLSMDDTAEQIYDRIMPEQPPKQGGGGSGGMVGEGDIRDDLQGTPSDGDGDGDGDGTGGDSESGKGAPSTADLQREMGQRVSAGAVTERAKAKREGRHVDAWMQRLIDDTLEDKVNWRVLLQRLVKTALARDDYSMRRPSRRGLQRGVVLPSLRSEAVNEIRVVCDTSGSVTNDELSRYAAEVSGIINRAKAKRTLVAFVDTDVRSVQEFSRRDNVVFKPAGGGGTDMRTGFAWAAEGKPDLLVLFTDAYTPWPDEKPSFPVVVVLASTHVADKSTIPSWATVVEIDQ